MTLVDDIQAVLAADADVQALEPDGIPIVIDVPDPRNTPQVFDPESGRIKRSVYVYTPDEAQAGPFTTSSVVLVRIAHYGPTGRACEALELATRRRLHDQHIGGRQLRWQSAPTFPDTAFDPPEQYTLGRYTATGFWQE